MATWGWILIAVAAVLVVALVVVLLAEQRRSRSLRRQFGPEYERVVEARDSRRAAEADLRGREKLRARLDIRPLPGEARMRFSAEWREVQEHFVDQPSFAVLAAQDLVTRVMGARGYPVDDFESQAGVISVDHPHVVDNYRIAHDISGRARSQQANTEDLREAMLRYRSLFDELLRDQPAETTVDGKHASAEYHR